MSDLQDLCALLDGINGDILGMAKELHGRAQSYSRAAAQAAAAAQRAEGEAAAALARAASALDAAARHCVGAATSLNGASREGQAYVQRTVGSGSSGPRSPESEGQNSGRGSSNQAGQTVLEDGTSPVDDADTTNQVAAAQRAFVDAHDPQTMKFDPSKFIRFVNPNFEGYCDAVGRLPHNINCGLCAQAVALALDGRPHIAGGVSHGVSEPEMSRWAGSDQGVQSPNDIEKRFHSMPAGSHAIIGVDYVEGGGHWFNAYWDGVTVWSLDGQVGRCEKWPPSMPLISKWDAIFTEGGNLDWKK